MCSLRPHDSTRDLKSVLRSAQHAPGTNQGPKGSFSHIWLGKNYVSSVRPTYCQRARADVAPLDDTYTLEKNLNLR